MQPSSIAHESVSTWVQQHCSTPSNIVYPFSYQVIFFLSPQLFNFFVAELVSTGRRLIFQCAGNRVAAERAKFDEMSATHSATHKDLTMTRHLFALMLGFALALAVAPKISIAAEDHIAEAVIHTKQAIDEGKLGKADGVVTHAQVALTHAEAAEKAKPNSHTKEGIEHLKQAIADGKKGHAESATEHAEKALEHLQKAG
jgi:hypothetical protein